jgi:hypothetical protein
MKTRIIPLVLLGLSMLGCENMLNEEDEKTEAELRAERNKPIYEQFIGEWDNYSSDDFETMYTSREIIATDTEFTFEFDSDSSVTPINYEDLIYTLEEFREEVVNYDGGVDSSDLRKEGFIKLERSLMERGFEFFKYHFYDENKFSLKWVVEHYGSVSRDSLYPYYYKRTGSPGGSGSGTQVDLPGAYSLTAGSYNCTLTFSGDGTYLFDHPVAASDRSGTWTQNGGEVTMASTVTGIPISEVFITTESGNVVTLTLKDTSAAISNILASFNLAARSVSLTRK